MIRRPHHARWIQLLPLDMTLALTIVGVCLALGLNQLRSFPDKVRLIEVLLHTSGPRMDISEQIALTGEALPGRSDASEARDSFGGFDYRSEGTGFVATGTLKSLAEPFAIAFRPSWIADVPATNILWLCAAHRPLDGWTAPAGPTHSNLPAAMLFFPCRDTRAR